jgi:prepilin-type N-terminal cleavage/methylation domain-containing protein
MRRAGPGGFTLIELLVVVAVIAVLAAVAIPQYASYKRGAVDSSLQVVLHDARTAMEAFYASNDLSYEGATTTALEAHGFRAAPDVTLAIVDATRDGYQLRACAPGASTPSLGYDSDVGSYTPGGDGC